LDTSTPLLRIVQAGQTRQQIHPSVPLGSRGKFDGHQWEVIGFQIRTMTADGVRYDWAEYVLFNPYKGFRYLTEYDGHWNYVQTVPANPERIQVGKKPGAKLMGHTYVLFDTELATTSYVLGEFPWRVHIGEKNGTKDFIAVPRILSAE